MLTSLLVKGAELRPEDLAELRPEARLFACSSPDEPFLRERPRRCQLFRVAQAASVDHGTSRLGAFDDSHVGAPDTALARWHEGKVVAVPEHMSSLRVIAADRLALAVDVGSIRFRSAGSGLLIFGELFALFGWYCAHGLVTIMQKRWR